MDNILSPEDIHERILLSNLPVSEHLMSFPDSLGMALIALELSYAWPVESESRETIRRPFLHVSRIQHNGAVVFEDELAHHLWDFFGKDLKPEEVRQVIGLKILDQLLEEHGVDAIQVGSWPFAILVGLHLAAASHPEDVAVDLCRLEIGDSGGLGPAPANGREGSPNHNVAFVKPKVSMDEMYSELVLNIEALEETGQLLKVNLLHVRLVSVVWEKVVTVPGRSAQGSFTT